MSENRSTSRRASGPGAPPGANEAAEDFRALRTRTARHLPGLNETVRGLRIGPRRKPWEEFFMQVLQNLSKRPLFATAAIVAIVALSLLVIPVSYERTVGHDVALTLSGPNLTEDHASDLAREFRSLLGVDRVIMSMENLNGEETFVLNASVSGESEATAAAKARAFAAGLEDLGYAASAVSTPRKQRVSGNVYAFARDRVIEISLDGKSAPALEAEIRQRLAEAGITDARVSVTDLGDDKKKITIEAEHTVEGQEGAGGPPEELPELVLTKDGAPVTGTGLAVRLGKAKNPDGTQLVVMVRDGVTTAKVEIPGYETLSDGALASEIESRLSRQGIDVNVTVTQGKVEITRKTAGP